MTRHDRRRYLVSTQCVGVKTPINETQLATLTLAKAHFLEVVAGQKPRPTGMFKAEVFDRDSVEPDYVLHITPRGAVKALAYTQELKAQGA
jgi:hypothetical protein